jgi:hypothetical protein
MEATIGTLDFMSVWLVRGENLQGSFGIFFHSSSRKTRKEGFAINATSKGQQ